MQTCMVKSLSAALFGVLSFSADVVGQQRSSPTAFYAALAVVPGQGRDYNGYATGPSESDARDAALRQCANSRCKVVKIYGPGQCAHVVLGTRQIFWNDRLFGERELEYTLQACNKNDAACKVIHSECLPEATMAPSPGTPDEPIKK
jgi:uncharacterized protein DUF4189